MIVTCLKLKLFLNKLNMIKKTLFCILFFLISFSVFCQELKKIETYKGPDFVPTKYILMETYDFRIRKNNYSLPPTLTDVFIWDLWKLIKTNLKIDTTPTKINTKIINSTFDIYLQNDYKKIPGFRPWTHMNFIRSLSKIQREKLSDEIVAYIKSNGINKETTKPIYKNALNSTLGYYNVKYHTSKTKTIGMTVFGPLGSGETLESKANEIFITYKPHVNNIIVTFEESSKVNKILVGVVYDGVSRRGLYKADEMINFFEKVLANYKIPLKNK